MNAKRFILQKVAPGDVRRSRDIGRVVQELESLPEDKSWCIEIENIKSERSLRQNKYLFGVAYKLISEKLGYEKDDLHMDLLKRHFGARLKKVPPSKYIPSGLIEIPVRTTTTDEHGRRSVLGKLQFAEYVDFVRRWALDLEIDIPDPDPEYQLHRQRGEAA